MIIKSVAAKTQGRRSMTVWDMCLTGSVLVLLEQNPAVRWSRAAVHAVVL